MSVTTVTVALLVMAFEETVMTMLPGLKAVATPVDDTVAEEGMLELQSADVVSVAVEPSEYVPSAEKTRWVPSSSVADVGLMARLLSVAAGPDSVAVDAVL